MDTPTAAQRHIADDEVAWLTTVSDRGAPTPNPVWFVRDGDDLVVFASPSSRKVHNVEQRPAVSLHFNSDPEGHDAVMVAGEVSVTRGRKPSTLPAYIAKYDGPLQKMGMSAEQLDAEYHTELRIRPTRIRTTPDAPST